MAGIELNSDAIAAQLKDSMAEHNVMQNQIYPPLMPYQEWVEQLYNQPNQCLMIIQQYLAEQQIRIDLNLEYQGFAIWYQHYTLTMHRAYIESNTGGQHVPPLYKRKEPSKILQYSGQFSSSGKSRRN